MIDEGRIWWTSPPRSCGGAFSVAGSHDPVGCPSVAPDLPGVTRRASEAQTTILVVDSARARIERVIAMALSQGGIDDVAIEDPPMEEVIHEIYAVHASR